VALQADWRFGEYDLVVPMEYSDTEAPLRWRQRSAPLPSLRPNRNDAPHQPDVVRAHWFPEPACARRVPGQRA
jgi:hypothetical protein